ncbi:hypothetical protein OEZ86_006165 [Tetradesmus obliquus]|nr:hypothetical protein OEZ86_006165 [Tetradesmus obliquus]
MQPAQMPSGQMQAPLQQQQGMPMQFAPQPQQGMPGQPYTQAASVQQPTYMQQAPAFSMGQPLAPGMQAPAMGQMPAAGQSYMQQGPGYDMAQMQGYSIQAPVAGQGPAGVLQAAAPAAAQAQSEPTVTHFQEDWVNIVGLTGVVLQGPFLQQFGTGKVKVSMVLGVLARATGDAMADAPRPILVEAWGERAYTLAQQVQGGALLSVLGHLALDMRPQESTPSHGPALTVLLDSWELVTAATVPSDRPACAYKGEYNVAQAVQQNTESLTKAGHVRMKVVRAFLLSPQCQLSQEVQQQESSTGGVNKTYSQIRLLLAMIRVGIRL